jgi:hypothetical protein
MLIAEQFLSARSVEYQLVGSIGLLSAIVIPALFIGRMGNLLK